jgi:F420-0:gamma-glutamyl ligase
MKTQDRLARLRHEVQQMKSGDDLLGVLLGLIDTISDLEEKYVGASVLSIAETEAIFGEHLDPSPDQNDIAKWKPHTTLDPARSLDIDNWMLHEKND